MCSGKLLILSSPITANANSTTCVWASHEDVSGPHMNQAKSSIMVAGHFIYGAEDLARANGIKLVFPPTKYLGTWNCSHFAMPAAIKEEIHNTVLFTRADPDRWTWTISKHGVYTTASAYKGIRRIETPVWWNKLVWSKWALPRHNFLMWQAGTSWCSLDIE
ncbi:hypothetical protein IFM89_035716 [Coptis chinensis]|uniref:Reverse transcriptase zinc-binding domain-containing protein n=1 Tax=Coptis chinensis TaxID=261450 RepID=A0A835H2D3_9MAGN|nr:hypothetical protein IFM89_035716 [Coptis chinensis]